MGIKFGDDGIRFGGVKVTTDVHAKALAEIELNKAADDLSDATYRVTMVENLYRDSGLQFEYDVLRKMRIKMNNLEKELEQAIKL